MHLMRAQAKCNTAGVGLTALVKVLRDSGQSDVQHVVYETQRPCDHRITGVRAATGATPTQTAGVVNAADGLPTLLPTPLTKIKRRSLEHHCTLAGHGG